MIGMFARRFLAALLSLAVASALFPAVPVLAAEEAPEETVASAATEPEDVSDTQTAEQDTSTVAAEDDTVRILCVGNSWTRRSVKYLCSIAKSAGKKVIVGHAFLKSSSLQEQYFSLLGGGTYISHGAVKTVRTSYEYDKYVNSDDYTVTKKSSLEHAIQDEPWDYLVLQNRAPESGEYAVWDKTDSDNAEMLLKDDGEGGTEIVRFDINDFVDLIEQQMDPQVAANLKVGLSAVWSYADGLTGGLADSMTGYLQAKYGGKLPHTQQQWNAVYEQLQSDIQTTIPQVAEHMGQRCDFIVNPGLAFYYARQDDALASFGYKLHASKSDAHPAEGIPCYIAGLTYAFALLDIGWEDIGYYPKVAVTSYGTDGNSTVTPTGAIALRAVACAWRAQEGSRINISTFAASPLWGYSDILSEKNAPALELESPTFGTLVQKVDYKITSRTAEKANNTLSITFKGTGAYTGSATVTFALKPGAVPLVSAQGSSAALQVTWTAPGSKNASGVQVRYVATTKELVLKKRTVKTKSGKKRIRVVKTYKTVKTVKVTTVKSAAKKKLTIKKLAKGSYEVQVRAYRLVSGTKYTSSWSAAKTVRVR